MKQNGLEQTLSVVVTLCALVVTAAVVQRSFIARAAPVLASEQPTQLEGSLWQTAVASGYRLGDTLAPVTIIEIADLECPACRVFHEALRTVMREYPEKISVVHVPYPLSYHRMAMPAARAADCALRHGKLAAFVDVVFEQQDSLGLKGWGAFAADAGIAETAAIGACARDTVAVPAIEAGLALGSVISVRGTPTVLINGWQLSAVPSLPELRRTVELIDRGESPFGGS